MHHFAKSYDNIDFLEAEDIFALALRQACIAMDHPDVLRCPTILKTPIGELHRQWAVLDGYKLQRDPDGSGSTTSSPVWAEFPTPLNDIVNQKLDQLRESQLQSLSAYRTFEESDEVEHFSKIKYKWTNELSMVDYLDYAPFRVDMVLDLQNMTQRNMQSGTEQTVAFWYK